MLTQMQPVWQVIQKDVFLGSKETISPTKHIENQETSLVEEFFEASVRESF